MRRARLPLLRVENSWGEDRGDKGFFTMTPPGLTPTCLRPRTGTTCPPTQRAAITEEPLHLPARTRDSAGLRQTV